MCGHRFEEVLQAVVVQEAVLALVLHLYVLHGFRPPPTPLRKAEHSSATQFVMKGAVTPPKRQLLTRSPRTLSQVQKSRRSCSVRPYRLRSSYYDRPKALREVRHMNSKKNTMRIMTSEAPRGEFLKPR